MTVVSFKQAKSRLVAPATIAVAVTVLMVGSTLALLAYLRNREKQSSSIRQQLTWELDNVQSPTEAVQVRRVDAFKGTHGNIANYYKTNLTYDELRNYYDGELERRGWKLRTEKKLTTWQKDLGESLRTYCKGPFAANVYFTGKNETALGFKYSLSVSWRLVEECGS